MSANIVNNKKIVKNTLALYFRQIIVMAVTMFTSRIILQALGVTDYGIYAIIGGVVAMFGFMSTTLMGITQRFISIELGKGSDTAVLRKIFSTSMILHAAIAIIVIILAETVGLWFLNSKLVIPAERMSAANWVYQFTVLGFVVTMLSAPLTALIISHEDMHVYGYMGIFDVAMRLAAVYLLVVIDSDKLTLFALFSFTITCLIWLFYYIYCRKKYIKMRFTPVYDKPLIKKLSGFGGYIFAGNIFSVLIVSGTGIILNIFFGPVVNAANGLANSVNSALLSFGNNFRQTLTPQIMMSYAANKLDAMWSLVERGTRMYFFLFLIFSLPVLLEIDFILKLWLKNVPEYTAVFIKLMIINALIGTLLSTFISVVNASGKLKGIYCTLYINHALILVFSYLVCKIGYPPQYVFVTYTVITLIFNPVYFALAKKIFNFPVRSFIRKALIPIFFVSALSFFPFYFAHKVFSESILRSCIVIITSMLWTGLVVTFVGLRKTERTKIINFMKRQFLPAPAIHLSVTADE